MKLHGAFARLAGASLMAWHWLAFCSEQPRGALAVAELHAVDGTAAGFIAAWPRKHARPLGALGVDARAIDPAGGPAWLSVAVAPSGMRFLFDDPAVSWALRCVLARQPVRAISTLTLDSAAIGGALTAYDACPPLSQSDDPFARLFPTRVFRFPPTSICKT